MGSTGLPESLIIDTALLLGAKSLGAFLSAQTCRSQSLSSEDRCVRVGSLRCAGDLLGTSPVAPVKSPRFSASSSAALRPSSRLPGSCQICSHLGGLHTPCSCETFLSSGRFPRPLRPRGTLPSRALKAPLALPLGAGVIGGSRASRVRSFVQRPSLYRTKRAPGGRGSG